jgi:molybdate transport system substrate-binding protein
MRSFYLAAIFAAALAPAAQAAEVTILAPGFIDNAGVKDLAAAYTKQTGIVVNVKSVGMGSMLKEIESGNPAADIVALPASLMDQLELEKGIQPGSRKPLGRVEIDLAVPAGAPHPDISTPEKAIAVLKGAKGITYSNPFTAEGSMEAFIIHTLLLRPDLKGVHPAISSKGNGPTALENGEGDMTLQLANEIDNHPKVSHVGPLPPLFGAHIDGDIAISARAGDPKAAAAVIAYMLRPASNPVWKKNYLDRH